MGDGIADMNNLLEEFDKMGEVNEALEAGNEAADLGRAIDRYDSLYGTAMMAQGDQTRETLEAIQEAESTRLEGLAGDKLENLQPRGLGAGTVGRMDQARRVKTMQNLTSLTTEADRTYLMRYLDSIYDENTTGEELERELDAMDRSLEEGEGGLDSLEERPNVPREEPALEDPAPNEPNEPNEPNDPNEPNEPPKEPGEEPPPKEPKEEVPPPKKNPLKTIGKGIAGLAILGLAVAGGLAAGQAGKGLDKGGGGDADDLADCDSLGPVAKDTCVNTKKARQALQAAENTFYKSFELFGEGMALLAAYAITCAIITVSIYLIFTIILPKTGEGGFMSRSFIFYGKGLSFENFIYLIFKVIIGVILFNFAALWLNWFFYAPKTKCTNNLDPPTFTNCSSPIRTGQGCFAPGSPHDTSQSCWSGNQLLTVPPVRLIINSSPAKRQSNYIYLYGGQDESPEGGWKARLPQIETGDPPPCRYFQGDTLLSPSSPLNIDCEVTDISDTDYQDIGYVLPNLDYCYIVINSILAIILVAHLILILLKVLFHKSADSQVQEHLDGNPGAKIDSKAAWGKGMFTMPDGTKKRSDRGKIMQGLSSVEQAAKGFAEGLATSVKGLGKNRQEGGSLNTTKINKYNKWLIVFLLIFAMIITHYYKKQRGTQKDKQYIQKLKEKSSEKINNLQNDQNDQNDQSNSGVQPYQPISVFGGQYL